jgi:hypothetical protein
MYEVWKKKGKRGGAQALAKPKPTIQKEHSMTDKTPAQIQPNPLYPSSSANQINQY